MIVNVFNYRLRKMYGICNPTRHSSNEIKKYFSLAINYSKKNFFWNKVQWWTSPLYPALLTHPCYLLSTFPGSLLSLSLSSSPPISSPSSTVKVWQMGQPTWLWSAQKNKNKWSSKMTRQAWMKRWMHGWLLQSDKWFHRISRVKEKVSCNCQSIGLIPAAVTESGQSYLTKPHFWLSLLTETKVSLPFLYLPSPPLPPSLLLTAETAAVKCLTVISFSL